MFQVGDRVRVVKDTTPDGSLTQFVGMTGVVTGNMYYIKVALDHLADDRCFVSDELETVEENT